MKKSFYYIMQFVETLFFMSIFYKSNLDVTIIVDFYKKSAGHSCLTDFIV